MHLTGISTPGLSRSKSNCNEGVFHTALSFRTSASPSDLISCHNQDTTF